MATLQDVLDGLKSQVVTALTNAGISTAKVGVGWPPPAVLQTVTQGSIVIGIIHKVTAYKAQHMDYEHSIVQNELTISSALSDFSLAPGQNLTITLALSNGASAVAVNDAVSCQLTNGDFDGAAMAIAVAGDTIATLAAALATAINSKFAAQSVSATANAGVVTVTNAGSSGFDVSSSCGNEATINEAVTTAFRNIHVACWSNTSETRYAVQAALEPLFGQLEDQSGFALASGEIIKLKLLDAKPDDTGMSTGILADHYIVELDHEVDSAQQAYEINAAIGSSQTY